MPWLRKFHPRGCFCNTLSSALSMRELGRAYPQPKTRDGQASSLGHRHVRAGQGIVASVFCNAPMLFYCK